jgi:cytochrome P450 family 130
LTSVNPVFVPCSAESWRDPFSMYAALRDRDPVHHVEGADYWVLSRYEHVFAAARDPVRFSSAQGLTFSYDDMSQAGLDEVRPIVMLDPPAHTEFRRMVSKGFTPRQVESLEPEVRAFVAERVERLRAEGGGDVIAELFKPLPSLVVAHYLGVPREDRSRFDRWTHGIVAATSQGDPLSAPDAVAELFTYFSDLVARRRTENDFGDDTISQLARTDADEVSILQILGFAFTMVTGGNDTTTGLLGGASELLTERPDERARLLDDPHTIGAAVEELLRLTSPVQGLARTTTEDVVVDGRRIPEGRKVMLLYGAANRDPRRFGDDADELDVGRNPRPILSFGYGNHHCLGAAAARLQSRIALEELLARCPRFAVDAGRGVFAPGHFVRRYESLPFDPEGL